MKTLEDVIQALVKDGWTCRVTMGTSMDGTAQVHALLEQGEQRLEVTLGGKDARKGFWPKEESPLAERKRG